MEIVIRTDGEQTAVSTPAADAPPAVETAALPTAGETTVSTADLVARATASGAIDAGAARIPDGTGQPLTHVATQMPGPAAVGGGKVSGDYSAGSASAFAVEPAPTIIEAEPDTAL